MKKQAEFSSASNWAALKGLNHSPLDSKQIGTTESLDSATEVEVPKPSDLTEAAKPVKTVRVGLAKTPSKLLKHPGGDFVRVVKPASARLQDILASGIVICIYVYGLFPQYLMYVPNVKRNKEI